MCMQPVFGALSDRIGRRSNMLLFGALGTLMTVPVLSSLQNVSSPLLAGVLIIVDLAVASFYTSISGNREGRDVPAGSAGRWASACHTRWATPSSAAAPSTLRWA